MSFGVKPESLATILQDIERRLNKLETYPNGALTQLVPQTGVSTSALPFTTTATDIETTRTASFQLLRPTSILVIPTAVFYTSGGTAGFGFAQAVIEDSLNGNALVAECPGIWSTNGAGIADACHPFTRTLNEGTYTVVWQYHLDSGAATTWTGQDLQLEVFQFGG